MGPYRVALPVAAFLAALGGPAAPAAAATGADLPGVSVVAPELAAGTELEVAGIDDVTVDRGNYTVVPITVRNDSAATVHHVAVVVVAERGVEPAADYANCAYDREDDFTFTAVTCLVDRELAPGGTAAVPAAVNPMLLKVTRDAGGPHTYAVSVTAVGVSDAQAAALAAKSGKPAMSGESTSGQSASGQSASGPRLTMSAAAAPGEAGGSVAAFGVTVGAGPGEAVAAATAGETAGGSGRSSGWLALPVAGVVTLLAVRRRRIARV